MGLLELIFGKKPPKSGGADPNTAPSKVYPQEIVDPTEEEN